MLRNKGQTTFLRFLEFRRVALYKYKEWWSDPDLFLGGRDTILGISQYMTDSGTALSTLPLGVPSVSSGVNILDYRSRIEFGCKLLGYNASQGCTP